MKKLNLTEQSEGKRKWGKNKERGGQGKEGPLSPGRHMGGERHGKRGQEAPSEGQETTDSM